MLLRFKEIDWFVRKPIVVEFGEAILSSMADVTQMLEAVESGDRHAAEELLPHVYDELRKLAAAKLAQEKPGQTLDPTALVHEAYLRLVGNKPFANRGHFFAVAAEAMRRILINRARDKGRQKRSGGRNRVDLELLTIATATSDEDLLDLNDALEQLAAGFPQCAELVKLRFFAGFTLDDAATALGMGRRTADRQWAFARAWLFAALAREDTAAPE